MKDFKAFKALPDFVRESESKLLTYQNRDGFETALIEKFEFSRWQQYACAWQDQVGWHILYLKDVREF